MKTLATIIITVILTVSVTLLIGSNALDRRNLIKESGFEVIWQEEEGSVFNDLMVCESPKGDVYIIRTSGILGIGFKKLRHVPRLRVR